MFRMTFLRTFFPIYRDIYDYFTTISWNNGVYFQRINDYVQSEKFMSIALQFLPKALSLQVNSFTTS